MHDCSSTALLLLTFKFDASMPNRRSWDYYRRHLKQNFINHDDEVDPERLEQIFKTARKDAEYLIQKVGEKRTLHSVSNDMHMPMFSPALIDAVCPGVKCVWVLS